jgi:hypothetical protein
MAADDERTTEMKTITHHLRYFSYVVRHKWFVLTYGIRIGVPIHLLILHDLSKFLPDEWMPYVESFYGDRDRAKPRFDLAWLKHQRRNRHHWQSWVLINDDDGIYPLPMPDRYIREMIADWRGAGRAMGKTDSMEWYISHRDKMILHRETQLRVETLLLPKGEQQ